MNFLKEAATIEEMESTKATVLAFLLVLVMLAAFMVFAAEYA